LEEIENACDPEAWPSLDQFLLMEGARLLRDQLDQADRPSLQRVLVSQLHMTANRLGLMPLEEGYLGRLLSEATRLFLVPGSPPWSHFQNALRERSAAGQGNLEELVESSFEQLFV
jgi:hypothetical protein